MEPNGQNTHSQTVAQTARGSHNQNTVPQKTVIQNTHTTAQNTIFQNSVPTTNQNTTAQNTIFQNGVHTTSQKAVIIVDNRELHSSVVAHLRDHPAILEERQLPIGDYICSEKVCAERKTVTDFLSSLVDKRLFDQLSQLAATYEKPILLLEGNSESLFYSSIHPNAIRGALASISLDYRVPIIWTRNPKETAAQLYWIANREQLLEKRVPAIRTPRPQAVPQPLYLAAGLPGVNTVLAQRLLKKFRSVRSLATASPEDLQSVAGIGPERAQRIVSAFTERYKKPKKNE